METNIVGGTYERVALPRHARQREQVFDRKRRGSRPNDLGREHRGFRECAEPHHTARNRLDCVQHRHGPSTHPGLPSKGGYRAPARCEPPSAYHLPYSGSIGQGVTATLHSKFERRKGDYFATCLRGREAAARRCRAQDRQRSPCCRGRRVQFQSQGELEPKLSGAREGRASPTTSPEPCGALLQQDRDLSPFSHPEMRRVCSSFEPMRLGGATGWGAEPASERSVPSRCIAGSLSLA